MRLHELADEGWIELTRTDGVDTERTSGQPADVAARRLEETGSRYESEILGPGVLGRCRLGHAKLAGDEDDARIDRVLELIFGSRDRSKRKDLHDAMAVSTAIRYGQTYFVTRDQKILNAAPAIKAEFHPTQVMSPTEAIAFVERMIRR